MKLKVLFNERGSGMIVALAVAAAVGGGLVVYMKSMSKINKTVQTLNSQNESLVAIDKLRTIGSYLISSNTVICKQGFFTGQTEGYRCKWTGKQLIDGSLTDISKAKFGFDEGTYSENGFLTFKVDSSKLISSDEMKAQGITNFKGNIGFKLYNTLEDKLGIADKLGRIPLNNLIADNDRNVVLIKVDVDYKDTSSKSPRDTAFTEYFSTRRPIAIPKLIINQANCKRTCEVSVGRNDSPACRGDQNFRYSKEVAVNAKTENLGPGVLYELKVQKEIQLDRKLFPTTPAPAPTLVDAMPGRDYLLPGESIDWTDNMLCLDAKEVVPVYRLRGICYSDVSFSKQVPCNDDATNQHFVNAGTVAYKVDVSPYQTNQYHQVIAEIKKTSPDGQVPMNFKVPEKFKNKGLSRIEPARTVRRIVTTGEFPTKMDTTTQIIQIPTH